MSGKISSLHVSILALVTSFFAGSVVTIATIYLCQKRKSFASTTLSDGVNVKRQPITRKRSFSQNNTNNKETFTDSATTQKEIAKKKCVSQEIRAEQLSRHQLYFGDHGMKLLAGSRVCVVGVGGVGSHLVHMLSRSGIGMMRIIDFDQVSLSSLNRHAVASLQDVGIPKVTCMVNYIRRHICPDEQYLKLEAFAEMYTIESAERLLELNDPNGNNNWTMVIDCIDDIPTKAALLKHCLDRKIRVISCMGAGGKADFTRLHWSDLQTASKDPLATKLRQTLKRLSTDDADGITSVTTNDDCNDYLENMDKLSVLYCSEKTVVKLAAFTEKQKLELDNDFNSYGAVDGMRIRIVPVLGTMPAIFGQALATICLTVIGGKAIRPVPGERVGRDVRNRIFQRFRRREQKLRNDILNLLSEDERMKLSETKSDCCVVNGVLVTADIQIDQDDVEYLLELWRNRCAVTGARLGTVLELVRWDLTKPPVVWNLVLVSANVVSKFDIENINQSKAVMETRVRNKIINRLASVYQY